MTDDLVAFLRARLDEDEQVARAEVQAKRRIIDWHRHATFYREPIGPTCEVCGDHDGEDWCMTLRLLALPYAGVDGYRAEWAPDTEVNRGR